MAREQGGEQAPALVTTEGTVRGSRESLMSVPLLRGSSASESLTTVLVAFTANILVAVAKSAAAALTGSASLVAEAAHSWADSGKRDLPADRQPAGAPPARPRSSVRSWPGSLRMVAVRRARALRGGRRRIGHARRPGTFPSGAGEHFLVGYVVLAVSFVLEGISFLQSVRQARSEAASLQRDVLEHVMATSDPTLRAVFRRGLRRLDRPGSSRRPGWPPIS